jgi:hypothetical protein
LIVITIKIYGPPMLLRLYRVVPEKKRYSYQKCLLILYRDVRISRQILVKQDKRIAFPYFYCVAVSDR